MISPKPVLLLLPNGATIAYTDRGSGQHTILFIHGLATSGLCWEKNVAQLSKTARCICIDLPGHGAAPSAPSAATYSMEYLATCVLHVTGMLRLERVILAGHSMGGQVAITAALIAPAAIAALVLCAPAGFEVFQPHEKQLYYQSLQYADWFSNDEHSLRQSLTASFSRINVQATTLVEGLLAQFRKHSSKEYRRMVNGCIHGMLEQPVFQKLGSITIPAIVLFGELDALIPNRALHPQTTRAIATAGTKKIKNAKLFMLRDAGHFVQWEKAEAANELIGKFLDQRK